jgi:hypothetical protein
MNHPEATMRGTDQSNKLSSVLLAALLSLAGVTAAQAEAYIGVGAGRADVRIDSFDADDSAMKLIAGYILDLPAVDFSVEASYVDFGTPNDYAVNAELEITGIDAFAVTGIDFGLVGLFAKAGLIVWDADARAAGFSGSDDGTDSAYGVGIRFNVRSLVVRAEYEKFDIDAADDLDMLSASLIWRF